MKQRGIATRTLLKEILPQVILSIPFPKKMRWADLDIEFARPIHTILAMMDNQVIRFQLGNITSNRFTNGHSFMAPAKIKLETTAEYLGKLRSARVIADIQERRRMLEDDIAGVARKLNGRILPDEELVDIVNNLVEYPVAVVGNFDEAFLEVPDEVRKHIRDRLRGILFSQSFDIINRGICLPEDLNLGCQLALGFRKGPLDIMRNLVVR